jgi:thiol-disulfide isomerase/thioredoxin
MQNSISKLARLAIALCLAALVALAPAIAEEGKLSGKPAPSSGEVNVSQAASREAEESAALSKVLETGPSDPLLLIEKLEEFLERFPGSTRRERVLGTIYRLATQSNDPRKAATAAEGLLEINPEDLELLTAVIGLYERQNDDAGRAKALHYGTRFIERAEKMASEPGPADVAPEKWQDTAALMRATAYFLRGGVYAKSGDEARAVADFEKSLEAYPTVQVAERLGDMASKGGETDRAIEFYATAFAFPDKSLDPAHRDEVRMKLGSAYVAKHQSEEGLGDLILARYDELARALKSRLAGPTRPNQGVHDPGEFVLERLDGSPARLAEYRGRVVVMDFWATWCGPCRLEGKLIEHVLEIFRDNPAVAFLAINVDEDRSGVPEFLRQEKWTAPVVYARGLDALMGVNALPTVMILDPQGRVAFRQVGLDPRSFVSTLETKVREILARSAPVAAASQ